MEATAWKEDYCDEGLRYRLQVNDVDGRAAKKLFRVVSDWEESGSGWNPVSQTRVLLFSRDFRTEKEWLKWAKHFPYKLIELNRKGNPKSTKLGIDARNKKG
jgi:hypothetical protein